MIATRSRIETLITAIQDEFLDSAGLTLTLHQAATRFAIDKATCEVLLGVLVDTGVLTRNRAGAFVRYFPPLAA